MTCGVLEVIFSCFKSSDESGYRAPGDASDINSVGLRSLISDNIQNYPHNVIVTNNVPSRVTFQENRAKNGMYILVDNKKVLINPADPLKACLFYFDANLIVTMEKGFIKILDGSGNYNKSIGRFGRGTTTYIDPNKDILANPMEEDITHPFSYLYELHGNPTVDFNADEVCWGQHQQMKLEDKYQLITAAKTSHIALMLYDDTEQKRYKAYYTFFGQETFTPADVSYQEKSITWSISTFDQRIIAEIINPSQDGMNACTIYINGERATEITNKVLRPSPKILDLKNKV